MKYILNENQIIKVLKNLSEESNYFTEGLENYGEGIYKTDNVGYYDKNKSYYFNELEFVRNHKIGRAHV